MSPAYLIELLMGTLLELLLSALIATAGLSSATIISEVSFGKTRGLSRSGRKEPVRSIDQGFLIPLPSFLRS